MNAETVNDIERMLKEVGYSDSAIKEILRWYEQNNIDRRK